jgi:molybdopterin-guanine dinucleotide biosynthesis protein A
MNTTRAPLHGLVLAGGASRRMGRDKAAMQYHGKPQVQWARELLARHCEQVFVSVRADQQDDPLRRAWPVVVDLRDGVGPIAGIAAAQHLRPDCAWLVLACDLPFVTDECLRLLVAHRDGRPIVAFRSSHDGLPEPLCAIFEPSSRDGILAVIDSGSHCPRRFVIRSGVELLDQPRPFALDNVNTLEEFAQARAGLAGARDGASP